MKLTLGYGGNGYYNMYRQAGKYFTGERTYELSKASNQAQISYDEYLRSANERALRDWHRNVPNRQIAYPEFSYSGAIYRADTSIARSMYSSDSSYTNYVGNLGYRTAGLYNTAGRLSRRL